MTWRRIRVYPFLFAIIPVLRLVAAYPGWSGWTDVAEIVGALLLASFLVYGLAFLLTRRRNSSLPALILLGAVVAFWGYVRVVPYVERAASRPHALLVPLWIAVTAAVIWWLVRRPALLDRAETFLSLMSGILIGWYLLTIAVHGWQSHQTIRQSATARQLSAPVLAQSAGRAGPKRDIYLIILDEYANAEVTGQLLGFDNRVFLDSLKQLGFYIPVVHSNYLHTFLSVPSLLNASQIAGLSNEVGRMALDRTVPDYLEEHNRIAPFLKTQGYQFVVLPTQYWDLPQQDPSVDRTMPLWQGLSIERELSRSMLRGVLKKTSLLTYYRTAGYSREQTKRILKAVNQVPKIPGPVFTFAHVMSPHSPYVFDRNCEPGRSKKRGTRTKYEGPAYVEQIECLNGMVLSLVTNLLRSSEVPPIILLQGDHGSKTLHFDEAPSSRKITLEQAKERLGAFGAYYLPDGGREAFGDSVTVVNVMGNILRHYFGAALPREPEDMYLSVDAAPYDFTRVDFGWLAREDWSTPSRRAGMQTTPPSAK